MDSSEQDLDSRTLAEKYFCLLGEREVTKNQNRTLQLSNQQLQEQVSKLVTNHQKVLIEKNEKIQHLEAVMETTVGRRCNLDDEEYLETVAKVDRLEQQVSGYQAKIKELEAKLAVKDAIKKELQDRRHAHEDLKEEYFSTKNQLERAADQLRQNHIAKTEREDKIEELEKKLASLRTEKNGKLETKLVELQEENRRLQNEIVIRANQMDQSECKSFEIQKKFDLQQSEFKKLQYRLTEVEDNCEKQCVESWTISLKKQEQAQRAFNQMICVDSLPMLTSEKIGFRHFIGVLAPGITIKSRTSLGRVEIPKLYEEYTKKLKCELENADSVSLSFDLWSSTDLKHEVIGIIVHFVSNNTQNYRVLGAVDMHNTRHTAINIQEKIDDVVKNYSIEEKIESVVRDGAANVVLTTKLMSIPNWDCFIHKLNLVMKAGLKSVPNIKELLEKMKKVVRKLHKSSVASSELEEIQDLLQIPRLVLVKCVEVRWSSVFDMIDRFLRMKPAIELLLLKNPTFPQLNDADWNFMTVILAFLHSTHKVLKLVQNRGQTASSIIPLCRILTRELRKASPFPTPAIAMASKLEKAQEEYEKIEYLKLATSFDPRFKVSYGTSREDLQKFLLKTAKKDDPAACETKISDDPFSVYLSENTEQAIPVSSDEKVVIAAEVQRWVDEQPDINTDPLVFWAEKTNQARFPTIFAQSRRFLCSPLGSGEVERLFSIARHVLTDTRKRLTPVNFERLLFLKVNIPLLGF